MLEEVGSLAGVTSLSLATVAVHAPQELMRVPALLMSSGCPSTYLSQAACRHILVPICLELRMRIQSQCRLGSDFYDSSARMSYSSSRPAEAKPMILLTSGL